MNTKKKRTNSRAKGANGEREAAKFLSQYNLPDGTPVVARRMARNGQKGQADLEHNIPDVHLEVKRNEDIDIGTVALYKALQQATDDAPRGVSVGVLWRRNGSRWRISGTFSRKHPALVCTADAHEFMVLGPWNLTRRGD